MSEKCTITAGDSCTLTVKPDLSNNGPAMVLVGGVPAREDVTPLDMNRDISPGVEDQLSFAVPPSTDFRWIIVKIDLPDGGKATVTVTCGDERPVEDEVIESSVEWDLMIF